MQASRQRLEALRQEYAAQIDDLTVGDEGVTASDPAHEGSVSDDQADDADALFEAERNMSLANNMREQLDLVETALVRIDAGTYGICIDCGKPIDPRRLQAIPYAQYCLEDQEKHDAMSPDSQDLPNHQYPL